MLSAKPSSDQQAAEEGADDTHPAGPDGKDFARVFQEIRRFGKKNEIEPRPDYPTEKSVERKILDELGIDAFAVRFSSTPES